eukprot:405095-Prymnesium_polylepis.1
MPSRRPFARCDPTAPHAATHLHLEERRARAKADKYHKHDEWNGAEEANLPHRQIFVAETASATEHTEDGEPEGRDHATVGSQACLLRDSVVARVDPGHAGHIKGLHLGVKLGVHLSDKLAIGLAKKARAALVGKDGRHLAGRAPLLRVQPHLANTKREQRAATHSRKRRCRLLHGAPARVLVVGDASGLMRKGWNDRRILAAGCGQSLMLNHEAVRRGVEARHCTESHLEERVLLCRALLLEAARKVPKQCGARLVRAEEGANGVHMEALGIRVSGREPSVAEHSDFACAQQLLCLPNRHEGLLGQVLAPLQNVVFRLRQQPGHAQKADGPVCEQLRQLAFDGGDALVDCASLEAEIVDGTRDPA